MHTSILNKDTVNLLSFICCTRVLSSQHMMHMAINAVAPLIHNPPQAPHIIYKTGTFYIRYTVVTKT